MPDETTGAAGTQADPGTQPPAGDSASQADVGGDKGQPESISLEEARKLRSEANSLRKRLRELEEAKTKADAETLSETEQAIVKARKEGATEALEGANARIRRAEVKAALMAAGVNPALLDLASKADEFAELAVTDEGEVQGVADVVAAFKKATPDLFRPAAKPDFGGGPRGQTPASAPSMNELLRAAARNG